MSIAAINIRLSDALLDELQRCTNRDERGQTLMTYIEEELEKFQKWTIANRIGPMAKFEMAAVRTFLYKTITGELDSDEFDIMNLPHAASSTEVTV